MRHRNAGLRGMSLVEIMVATAILTFGLLGVLDLYAFQIRNVGRTRLGAQANALARSHLAHCEGAGYAALRRALPADAAAGSEETPLKAKAEPSFLNDAFEWNVYLAPATVDGLNAVRVRVVVDHAPPEGEGSDVRKEVTGYVLAR